MGATWEQHESNMGATWEQHGSLYESSFGRPFRRNMRAHTGGNMGAYGGGNMGAYGEAI